MLVYAIRRVAFAIPTMLLATLLTFLTLNLVPGDPVELMLMQVLNELPTQEEVEALRAELGYDRPIVVRFAIWVGNVLRGDLGRSSRSGEPAFQEIVRTMPASIEIGVASMLVALGIAVPAGIISAVKRDSGIDYATRFLAIIGVSVPNFWLALLLMLVFAVQLGWLPVFGRGGIEHLILPAITLGSGSAALLTRLLRSSLLECLQADYVRTARAKGLRGLVVVGKHALRNAMLPIVTVMGLQLGFILGGSVVVETIFAVPGLGRLMVDSIHARDFVVVQGITLVYVSLVVTANLIVDLSYALLDPRIKY